jgi:hypothetical protein
VDDGSVVEGPGEFFSVECRGGDDHLELRAVIEQGPGDPQQEIDVQAPLVGLVDDQGVVFGQAAVGLGFGQEHAVCHDLDIGLTGRPVLKADLVADRTADGLAQLLGDAVGDSDGRDPARLGTGDLAADATAGLEAHLGDLGALTAAGLSRDDDDGMALDGPDDLVALGGDWKGRRILDARPAARALRALLG